MSLEECIPHLRSGLSDVTHSILLIHYGVMFNNKYDKENENACFKKFEIEVNKYMNIEE